MATAPVTKITDTSTTWDLWIQHAFRSIRAIDISDQAMYYGPWTLVLNRLFPMNDGFMVSVQHFQDTSCNEADSTVFLQVSVGNIPVLLVKVKPPGYLTHPNSCFNVDKEIRERCEEISTDEYKVPAIYLLSCLGHRFTVYELDTATYNVSPPSCGRHAPPETWWRWDILQPAGEEVLHDLVGSVRNMTQSIGAPSLVSPVYEEVPLPDEMAGVDNYMLPLWH